MREYKGIDIGRVLFACLIPILHIGFEQSVFVDIVRQYFSRLGVPFFFVVAGMFLKRSIDKYGNKEALKRYLIRVGRVLLIWVAIYSPFIIRPNLKSIQRLLFQTPAFLWYLTALFVAAIPFCLVKNRKILFPIVAVLYLVGTLFGDSYRWLLGGVYWYEEIFITTRNGIFFGLPLMCVGELTWRKEKTSYLMLFLSGLLLFIEITIVGMKASPNVDRSMYLFLPSFMFFLVIAFRNWNPTINTDSFGGISSAIYVMQYGIITIGGNALSYVHFDETMEQWLIWLMVVTIPTIIYLLLRKTRIVKWIF